MLFHFKLYIAALLTFLACDALWLGFVARGFYRKYLSFIMTPTPNWIAAAIFYLLFVMGVLVFVVMPGLKEKSSTRTVIRGGLFGLVTYATYDLTNLATVHNWPVLVTIVDMIWGMVLTISVSLVSIFAGRKFRPDASG